jgi:glycosyltransferase AglD
MKKNLSNFKWQIVISLNGPNIDNIRKLSKKLSSKFPEVDYVSTQNQGKGNGVINGWVRSKAEIRTYMDLDLATDLESFNPMISKINQGYDVCIGSRYHKKSKIKRKFLRRIASDVYNFLLIRVLLGLNSSDVQCGFKAVNKKFIDTILPLVKDRNWFFETEMMYLAHNNKLKIVEIPVKWKEGERSSLKLRKAAPEFFGKAFKLRFRN